MLKKILLALDVSKAGAAAQEYAMALAQEYKAEVTGIGIVDVPWITATQPEPLGGGSFKRHRDEAILQASRDRVSELGKGFQEKCQSHGIPGSFLFTEGFPANEIEKASQAHDVIVLGKTTDFHFDLEEDTDITVRHIARDHPRPLLIIPASFPLLKEQSSQTVLVCLDGDLRSSRALHIFLLLGLADGKPIEIISVHKDKEIAAEIVRRGMALCVSHGVKARARPIVSSDAAGEVILGVTEKENIGLIVMGAFSHTLLREAFFGSSTKILMKKGEIPLFLYS